MAAAAVAARRSSGARRQGGRATDRRGRRSSTTTQCTRRRRRRRLPLHRCTTRAATQVSTQPSRASRRTPTPPRRPSWCGQRRRRRRRGGRPLRVPILPLPPHRPALHELRVSEAGLLCSRYAARPARPAPHRIRRRRVSSRGSSRGGHLDCQEWRLCLRPLCAPLWATQHRGGRGASAAVHACPHQHGAVAGVRAAAAAAAAVPLPSRRQEKRSGRCGLPPQRPPTTAVPRGTACPPAAPRAYARGIIWPAAACPPTGVCRRLWAATTASVRTRRPLWAACAAARLRRQFPSAPSRPGVWAGRCLRPACPPTATAVCLRWRARRHPHAGSQQCRVGRGRRAPVCRRASAPPHAVCAGAAPASYCCGRCAGRPAAGGRCAVIQGPQRRQRRQAASSWRGVPRLLRPGCRSVALCLGVWGASIVGVPTTCCWCWLQAQALSQAQGGDTDHPHPCL